MNPCSLCREISGEATGINQAYDAIVTSGGNVLLETELFVVVPSIGALCPGHVLLCTKKHVESFRLYDAGDIHGLIDHIRTLVSVYFESAVVVFEHSGGKLGGCRSACVDHAHIHFVPSHVPLIGNIDADGILVEKYYNYPKIDVGYTYFSDIDGREFVFHVNESQYLRRIWSLSNAGTAWNWRLDHAIDNVMSTISLWRPRV